MSRYIRGVLKLPEHFIQNSGVGRDTCEVLVADYSPKQSLEEVSVYCPVGYKPDGSGRTIGGCRTNYEFALPDGKLRRVTGCPFRNTLKEDPKVFRLARKNLGFGLELFGED